MCPPIYSATKVPRYTPTHLFTYLPINLCTHLLTHPSFFPFIHVFHPVSIFSPTHSLPYHLSMHLPTQYSIFPPVILPIHPSSHSPIHPYTQSLIHLFIHSPTIHSPMPLLTHSSLPNHSSSPDIHTSTHLVTHESMHFLRHPHHLPPTVLKCLLQVMLCAKPWPDLLNSLPGRKCGCHQRVLTEGDW